MAQFSSTGSRSPEAPAMGECAHARILITPERRRLTRGAPVELLDPSFDGDGDGDGDEERQETTGPLWGPVLLLERVDNAGRTVMIGVLGLSKPG